MPSEMVRRSNLVDFAKAMKAIVESYNDEINFQKELGEKYPDHPSPLKDRFIARQNGVKFALDSFCERFDIQLP
jgi:hypothetical protein